MECEGSARMASTLHTSARSRYEQWMVLLVDQKTNRLVGYQKLTQNTRYEKVMLKFLAPKEGTVQYEIHCLCSAYLGADKKVRGAYLRSVPLARRLTLGPDASVRRLCAADEEDEPS